MSITTANSISVASFIAPVASARDVVGNHLKCFFEADLEGLLADYAPHAVFFTPDGTLLGVEQIRPLFQAMIGEFQRPGSSFNLKCQTIEGDYAYILWSAETADKVYEQGTDTFVVRGGKIVAQSFTGTIKAKR